MRIEQLIHVLEVARQNSITRAAKRLYISQPSLSASIGNLEKELNTKIFDRTLTGVTPTNKGKVILTQAQVIVNEIDKLRFLCADVSSALDGTITISTLPALSNFILLEVFSIFKQKHPEVNMIIKENDNNNIVRELETGDTDIGLVGLFFNKVPAFLDMLKRRNLCYRELFTDRLNIYAGNAHPLLNKKGIRLKDTFAYPVITYKNNMPQEIFTEMNWNFKQVLRFNDRESMKKMASSSDALTILPEIFTLNDLYVLSGQITPLDIVDFKVPLVIGIVFMGERHLSNLQQEFLTILNDTCARHWPH